MRSSPFMHGFITGLVVFSGATLSHSQKSGTATRTQNFLSVAGEKKLWVLVRVDTTPHGLHGTQSNLLHGPDVPILTEFPKYLWPIRAPVIRPIMLVHIPTAAGWHHRPGYGPDSPRRQVHFYTGFSLRLLRSDAPLVPR